jgi:uncharacterized membrane protein YhhN
LRSEPLFGERDYVAGLGLVFVAGGLWMLSKPWALVVIGAALFLVAVIPRSRRPKE